MSPDVRDSLISEGFQVPPRPPPENNHQGNKRLPLVINAAVEAEKKIRTIKLELQPEIESRNLKTFMGMIGINLSTKMDGLISSFQYE